MNGYRGSGMFYDLGQFLENNRDGAQRTARDLTSRANDLGATAEASINAAGNVGVSDEDLERQANVFQGKFRNQWDTDQAKLKARAASDLAAAEGTIQNMGSYGGLQQVLGQGRQGYTPGMSRLDAFALRADPTAAQTLSQPGQRFGGLRQMFGDAVGRAPPPDWKPPAPVEPTPPSPLDPQHGHPGGPANQIPAPPVPKKYIPPGGRSGRPRR